MVEMTDFSKNLVKPINPDDPVRLNKYMSDAGFCSRREADRLIQSGRVKIDGKPASVGQKVLPGQKVECDGKVLSKNEKMILIAFNKPEGIECTTDKGNPDNIIDFIRYPERIYPVGRLDKNSTGLILLTNTGELVNAINKSSNHHEKEYVVEVNKPVTRAFLEGMSGGVRLEERTTRKCTVTAAGKTRFNIILTEGLNRQIRRMCETFGYKVVSLKRIRIMNIRLGNLPEGHYRKIDGSELKELLKDLNLA